MSQVPHSENEEQPGSLTPQGILDALNADDNEIPAEDKIDLEDKSDDDEPKDKDDKDDAEDEDDGKDEDDDKDKDDDEGEEELEIEDEEEEPSEEEEVFAAPVRKRDILKKYPKLFKEFPYLEVAFYRDQRFAEIFPTVQDAKDAAESVEYLEDFENELLEGKTENLLRTIREEDENAFRNIVDNYVEVLGDIDRDAQVHVISGVAKNIIISLARDGKAGKNKELLETAQRLNAYLFGDGEFKPHQKIGKEIESDDSQDEHDEWLEERFNATREDLTTRIENSLRATIDSNIDPKESMTDYVRQQAARDVLQQMQRAIGDDRRFMQIYDELWRKSADDNFSAESQRKIRGAYLSKAKTVLPGVLRKVRQAALKGLGKRSAEGKKSNNKDRGRTTSSNKSGKKKSEDGRGMSTYDFLMQD